MSDDNARRIAEINQRLSKARAARVLAASRAASQLEAIIRPLRDRRLLDLIYLFQTALAERLAALPEGDAG